MARPGAFIVKERLEALEARIDAALEEEKLREFSRAVAADEMGVLKVSSVNEIEVARGLALEALKLEKVNLEARISEVRQELHVSFMVRVERLEKLITATAILGFVTLIAAVIL